MLTNPKRPVVATVVLAAGLCAAAQVASAAPRITVTRLRQTSTDVEIRVRGTGFTPNATHHFWIAYNWSFGTIERTVRVLANGRGEFSQVQRPSYNNSCVLGIWAADVRTGVTSNAVDLSLPDPCKRPAITVMMHDNERDATMTRGVNFTPPAPGESEAARAGIWSRDLATGETWWNDQMPVFSNGATGAHRHWGDARCGHTLEIMMYDKISDVWSNSVLYTLCP